jgi:alkylhydroperoxidase family enzyme
VPEPRIGPGAPADALRARLPELYDAYAETRATVLEGGIVDRELKQLCARYLAEDEELMDFERSDRFDGRQRAALRWTHAIAWSTSDADDELWAQLHAHFEEPELVELGYFIAFSLGQQHWLGTLGLGPGGRPRS